MVPATMALMLGLFPAILMALGVVREKELGSITNLYVTPVTRLEFLVGKQLPYIAVAMANFALLFLMALFVFQVPLKGSLLSAAAGRADLRHRDDRLWHADFGVHQHPDRRAVRHRHPDGDARDAVRRHDDAGLVAGRRCAQIMGRAFPMTYFVPISVGTFTKGLGFTDLGADLVALAAFHADADAA